MKIAAAQFSFFFVNTVTFISYVVRFADVADAFFTVEPILMPAGHGRHVATTGHASLSALDLESKFVSATQRPGPATLLMVLPRSLFETVHAERSIMPMASADLGGHIEPESLNAVIR